MLNKYTKTCIDAVVFAVALYLAYHVRYDWQVPNSVSRQLAILVVPVAILRILISIAYRVPTHSWRYVGLFDANRICYAVLTGTVALVALRFGLPVTSAYRIPLGVISIEAALSLLGTLGIRIAWRTICERHTASERAKVGKRILIVGASYHGVTIAKEASLNNQINVVGFVDDELSGRVIAGVPVLGRLSNLAEIVASRDIDEVLVCISPGIHSDYLRGLKAHISVPVVNLPSIQDVLTGNYSPVSGDAPQRPRVIKKNAPPALVKSSLRNKTIVITGGAGFIGSHLAEKLADHNELHLIDTAFVDKPIAFTNLARKKNVHLVTADLINDEHLPDVLKSADMVVHAAAIVGVGRVCGAARETLEVNYMGTSRIMKSIEANSRLERLLYFSTSEVFGVNSFRVDELTPPSIGTIAESRWSYAIAKLAGEHLVKSYFRDTGLPITIVRPFNVFGPRRTGDHALLRFVSAALAGKPLEIHGDGSQIRSWCYIEDFVAALLAMLEKKEATGEDFNIGNPANTITIHDLARKVIELTGSESAIVHVPHPFPDISIRVPSLAKSARILNYEPHYGMEMALPLTIEWYEEFLDSGGHAIPAGKAAAG